MNNFKAVELTEEQFSLCCDEWQACLYQSKSDPVFSSWSWCYSWWKAWSHIYGMELKLFFIYEENVVVGILPLYAKDIPRRFGPKGKQLQIIGTSWRLGPTVRTEYTSFIIKNGYEEKSKELVESCLCQFSWQDLIAVDHVEEQLTIFESAGISSVLRGQDRGVRIDCSGRFEDWLKGLGKNTRLKVFNRRNYLKDRLSTETVLVADKEQRDHFLNAMSQFNKERRDECISENELNFHKVLAENNHCLKLIYHLLKVDGEVVSVLYDLVAGGKRYNLQVVFKSDFDKKVSLGLMHLGFAIEKAFEDQNISIYDFLAGEGNNSFYKSRLIGDSGCEYQLHTSQISKTFSHKLYLSTMLGLRKTFNKYRKTN